MSASRITDSLLTLMGRYRPNPSYTTVRFDGILPVKIDGATQYTLEVLFAPVASANSCHSVFTTGQLGAIIYSSLIFGRQVLQPPFRLIGSEPTCSNRRRTSAVTIDSVRGLENVRRITTGMLRFSVRRRIRSSGKMSAEEHHYNGTDGATE